MPLNLQGNTEFTPYLKYNAKAGRFYVRFEGATEETELQLPLGMAIDFPSIKTGYIKFGDSGPPIRKWDPSLSVEAPSPDPNDVKFRRGFQVNVWISTKKAGLREFMSTAGVVCGPFMDMYAAWEAHGKPDEVPVYVCEGVEEVKQTNGTSYSPVFTLERWAPRNKVPGFDTPITPRGPVHASVAKPPIGAPVVSQEAASDYLEDDIPF